jgi:hypothetical protein
MAKKKGFLHFKILTDEFFYNHYTLPINVSIEPIVNHEINQLIHRKVQKLD